jgi:peroxiredoxin
MRTTTKLAALAAALVLVAGAGIAGDGKGKAALAIGAKAPSADVKMKGVDGKEVSIKDVMGAKGTLVVFTCNTCPYAKGWESRIVELGNSYAGKGIGVIAINANDPKVVADDGYDQMVARAKERGMKFPYVVDSTSQVAKAFGAARTPEVFLFDAKGALVYHGAVDDNVESAEKVTKSYLKDALDSVVAGKEVPVKETKAVGCGIKWHQQA